MSNFQPITNPRRHTRGFYFVTKQLHHNANTTSNTNMLHWRILTQLLLIICLCCLLANCTSTVQKDPQTNTTYINPDKGAGRWYEIASIPKKFAANCYCSYGEFDNRNDYVKVTNRCRRGGPNGLTSQVSAKLYPIPGSNNSKLRLKFSWPFRGEYWILYMDKNYQYSLGGTPNRKNLWIMSRKPTLAPNIIEHLKQVAKAQGYDVSRLRMTNQTCWKQKT